MKLENSFQVPAPPDEVYTTLLDLERVTPCMPGAELEELVDERTWKGKVNVKLGAVSLSYAATVVVEERDDEARRVRLRADARETRGKGMANASIDSTVEPSEDGGTSVEMATDLTVTGAVAQYGRGMIEDVSRRMADEFASCLGTKLSAPQGEGGEVAARPISGIRLGLWAILRAIGRLFKRLWAAISSPFRRR